MTMGCMIFYVKGLKLKKKLNDIPAETYSIGEVEEVKEIK